MTRKAFEQTKPRLGGDFWNSYKLASTVFRNYPAAISFTTEPLLSGLYADVTVTLENGEEKKARLFS